MRIGVVHARVQNKRVEVALVVVDTAAPAVLGHSMWRAPSGEKLSVQLRELYVRAEELFRAQKAEVVAAWSPDAPPGGKGQRAPLMDAMRAEGAAMAAAGAVPSVKHVGSVSGGTVRAAAGAKAGTDEAVDELAGRIADVPADGAVRRSVAAALAWALRN